MKNTILKRATYAVLVLSIPAFGWSLKKDSAEITKTTQQDTAVARTLTSAEVFDRHIHTLYTETGLDAQGLDYAVFQKALTGYYNLKANGKANQDSEILSIVDFNMPSSQKRLWIVDLEAKKVLFHTLVAHGKGTGDNYANAFSNIEHSNQSSLGFYVTGNTYMGKHGLSLKLNGIDKGYNTNAYQRGIVVHGAEYVSEAFVNQHGRLGRSQGCPALPVELTSAVVQTIKNGTTLFISAPNTAQYASAYLDINTAAMQYTGNQMLASL